MTNFLYFYCKLSNCVVIQVPFSEHFIQHLLDLFFRLIGLLLLDALCVQRFSSAYHCCNVWLFALLPPFSQLRPAWLFSSDLSHYQELLLTAAAVLFFAPFSANSWDCAWKSPKISSFWCQQSQALRTHFFTILTSGLNNSWTSWPCLHAFMHCCCQMISWLNIYIKKVVYRSTQ